MASSFRTDDLSIAWEALKGTIANINREAQTLHDACAAGSVEAIRIAQYCEALSNARDSMVRYAATPGLAAYARTQLDNPALDIVAEYVTIRNAVDTVRTWITANFPNDGGFLRVVQFTAQAKLARFMLTTAQTAGLRTELLALIAIT